jgi:hypothetical protein
MAQRLVVHVVYVLKGERASARLRTGSEMVSMSKSWTEGPHYHVLRKIILYGSTGDNLSRVSKPRPRRPHP